MAPDVRPAVLAIDFTARGCAAPEPNAPRCAGRAPVVVQFIPIGTAEVTRYLWHFGDGSMSSERTPSHTYALPGEYNVTLVAAGSQGQVSEVKPAFVTVDPNEISEPCEVDAQCAASLTCLCGTAARCPAAFTRGLCAAGCQNDSCREGQVCVDLARGTGTVARSQPWQAALCLRPCARDDECAPGLRCRLLPAGENGWAKACFADLPAELGSSCRAPTGMLRDDLCVTNHCADVGALGACTQECRGQDCPPGSECAELPDGRRLCLRPCEATFTCTGDPLLACVPANEGPFQVLGRRPDDATPFCAPKRCTTSDECGPSGRCVDDQRGAHCVRRTATD